MYSCNDLVNNCYDYYNNSVDLERINWVNIVLILSLEIMSNFCLISLINSTFKIISKILATKLSKVIDSLVDAPPSQYSLQDVVSLTIL